MADMADMAAFDMQLGRYAETLCSEATLEVAELEAAELEAEEGAEAGGETASLFCPALYQQHLQEARAWVATCCAAGTNPLDVCGERGDLYFLIRSYPGRVGWK